MEEIKRKNSKSIKDIPKEILDQLNNGELESPNLVEWFAVDQKKMFQNILAKINRNDYLESILAYIEALEKQNVNTVNDAIGLGILKKTIKQNDSELLRIISKHKSDSVKSWATYVIAINSGLKIREKLEQLTIFSANKYFGVKEICWLAVRKRAMRTFEKNRNNKKMLNFAVLCC